jgi:membrane protein
MSSTQQASQHSRRSRLDESWTSALTKRLGAARFSSAIAMFGSTMLLSALPLIIVLSSIANQRVDDDVSRHIGLDSHGAAIVRTLFRTSPTHDAGAIVPAVLIGLAGTIAAVQILQEVYERIFGLDRRGWRDLWRFIVWVTVLLAALAGEGVVRGPLRSAGGPVLQAIVSFAVLTGFFAWTMHFLLGGRLPLRSLVRPALVTALFWIGLAVFSSYVFSSTLVSDSRLYGTIGVMFTFLTWFLAVGAVLVLGACGGAVWQERSAARAFRPTG